MSYLDRVAALGCCICGLPAQIHHAVGGSVSEAGFVRGMGRKTPDDCAIPLCEWHHTGAEGLHKIGVREWERRFGPQMTMLEATRDRLGMPPVVPKASKVLARQEMSAAESSVGDASPCEVVDQTKHENHG
jgi:hypothetical protein